MPPARPASSSAAPSIPRRGRPDREAFRLDSADLTTHGLIVGMTGSGKTALGIVLIEELLQRGVPVLAIDPKGDLGNLLLDFPGLSPAEFAPFVDPSAGTAESEAKKWTDGLAGWGLGPADVKALVESRDAVIYTPGSSAGTPIDLFGSCAPPPAEADEDDRRDVVTAWVGGLLGLAGRDADPVKSRDFIFLSACVAALWEKGQTATFESLLESAAAPPFSKVGALPLETFYPAKDRQELVLAVNALLASPATSAFRDGEPLDVGRMLSATGRKARLSIVSIAHLGDAERVFVVATLLSRVKAWMRSQPGSPALRALVYIDEIFGFFPPSAEPPTKRPLLTLLKQARAFGVGVVLASQNPVDLDYRGLANCGCWWVGTLQTERDRKRLAEGLVEAGGKDASDAPRQDAQARLPPERRAPEGARPRRDALGDELPPRADDEGRPREAAGRVGRERGARPPGEGRGGFRGSRPPVRVAGALVREAERGHRVPVALREIRRALPRRAPRPRRKPPRRSSFPSRPRPRRRSSRAKPRISAAGELDALKSAAPARPLRYADLPGWFGEGAVKSVEKAVRTRLPDKLAATLLRDPVTGSLSGPGESADAFAVAPRERRRRGGASGRAPRQAREEAARSRGGRGGRAEPLDGDLWRRRLGAAVDILGGLLGKRKSLRVGKVGSVLTKHRMEGTAESKVEGLKAEVAALEAKLAPPDASRFEKVNVVPAAAHVDVLSIGVAWIC